MTDQRGIKLGTRRRISNEETGYEEISIISENFPKQRTLLLTPKDFVPPVGKKIDIVIAEDVLLSTTHHVAQDTSKESGGFLLGNRYECPNSQQQFVIIDQFMRADYTEGTQVSLTFTAESWAQLKDRLDGKFRGKHLIGWYHSHPGMGIFLSNYDLDIHRNRFSDEWNVALVIDPIKQEGGFFGWVGGQINPREKLEFHEMIESDSRETVVAWTNYVAEDPKTGLPASLKSVNTHNFNGNIASVKNPVQSRQQNNGGSLKKPILWIGALVGLIGFLVCGLLLGYWFLKSRTTVTGTDTTVENQAENNKVLDADRTRIPKKDLKGWVSSDNKLRIEMNVYGIGVPEVVQEIESNRETLAVTLNSQPAIIEESDVENGVTLKLRANSDLSPVASKLFEEGKFQDLKMSVEIFYKGDVISREINTKFRKGKSNQSLGEVIEFSGDFEDKKIPPTRSKPVSVTVERPQNETKPNTPERTRPETPRQSKPPSTNNPGGSGEVKVDVDLQTRPQPTKSPNQKPTDRKKDGKRDQQGGAGQKPIG